MAAGKKQRRNAARAPAAAVAQPASAPWWPWLLGIAVLIVLVFEIYGPALNGPFLLDDTYLPYDTPHQSLHLKHWISGVRPLLMFSYWLNYRSSGGDTFAYHVANVILHLLNGGLVWAIVRRFLARVENERWRVEALAIFAATLFLVHPLNTESVSYIASRSETLSVFFIYLAFAIFIYRTRDAISFPRAIAVILVFFAGVLTKEHAAVLPALLLLTDFWWNRGAPVRAIRANWKLYVPIVAAGALAAVRVYRVIAEARTAGFHMPGLNWHDYFFTQCRALWDYIFLFLVPAGQNIDHDFPFSHSVLDHGAIFGLLGLIAAIAIAWIYRGRFQLAGYGFFVYLLLMAPTSSFVPIADPFVERRLYLPFIGLAFITVDLVRRWRTTRPALVSALAAVLVVESALTYQRNQLWGNDVAMWQDASEKSPHKQRPRFQLARVLYGEDRCADAVKVYSQAAAIQPPDDSLLLDWGLAYDCAGEPNAAIEKIQQALAMKPSAHGYTQLAMVYGKHGDYDKALLALDAAQKRRPTYDMIYYYRGSVYARQGKYAQAVAQYQLGLGLNPANNVIREALARLQATMPQR